MGGIAREHTVLGFVTALLFGSGRKLASIPQATQLFFCSLLGLLLLSCLQIHFMWLGATWTAQAPQYDQGVDDDVSARLPFISTVGAAAALVGWPCVLGMRWTFMLANVEKSQFVVGTSWLIIFIA